MLVRSAGIRFGLLYAGLFGVSAAAMALFLWCSTAGLLQRQTETAINADLANLVERDRAGGIPLLEDTIEQRLEQDVLGNSIYALIGPFGENGHGNLSEWPPAATPGVDWFDLKVNRFGETVPAQARQIVLPDNYRLVVGRDITIVNQMANLLKDALLWCTLVVVALAIVGALTMRSLFRIQLADVSATAAAIGAGDLGRRVPTTGRGDEFDLVAETINDMLDRISRLMDGVRQVSNAIAHDLRTPIARARARLEDAARPDASAAELRGAIDRALADLDGLARVFAALLRIAEIESGARRQAFRAFDLAPLLHDVADLYEPLAEEKHCPLERHIPDRLAAFGDPEMVQQALANLVDNAVKFAPPGTPVQLCGRAEPEGPAVAVSDRGPGIPASDLEHVTERFFRGDGARSTPGSGLGLSLVQAVATLHGGALLLEDNRPGLRGVLTLQPAPPLPARAAEVEQTSSPPQLDSTLAES